MMLKKRLSLILFGLLMGSLCLVVGCAQDLPDINRTQPRGLDKSVFRLKNDDGSLREWYFRQTVTDVPFGSGATFIGEQSGTEKIVWDIQERFLYAYRSKEYVINSDKPSQRKGTPYRGAAIASFRIEGHFDVQRSYNPATGEQTNVIVENYSDRPWYKRKFMRVDFTRNLISDFRFVASKVKQQPVAYYVPETEKGNKDRAKIGDNYIDITHKLFLQPETHAYLSRYYGFTVPVCWLYSNISRDCVGQSIKIRSSFMLVKERGYVTKSYDNTRMNKFGFFRTVRYSYDRKYGETEKGVKRMANRWNLWLKEKSCIDHSATTKTHAKCKVRKIAYHVNENYPADLKKAGKAVFVDWNKQFREVVKRLSGKDQGNVFTFCPNNPVKTGDPKECGEKGLSPQIGDLRYSFIYWVDSPHRRSPLGYGPSASDPHTGEVFSANSFIYGAALDRYSNYATDLVRLINGDLKTSELTSGQHVQAYLKNLKNVKKNSRVFWKGDMSLKMKRMLNVEARGKVLKERVKSGRASYDWVSANLHKMKGAPGLEAVLPGEIFKSFGLHLLSRSGAINDEIRKRFGLQVLASPEYLNWSRQRVEKLSKHNIMMADFMDDGVLARALKMKGDFSVKGKVDYKKVYKKLREEIFLAVTLHEVGHNMGLRHNFAGSADALNFHDHYWKLKAETVPSGEKDLLPEYRYSKEHIHLIDNAVKKGLREYQYSSIMDYGGSFASDLHGLGKYDRAAILYGYGDMIEVFKSGVTDLSQSAAKRSLGPGDWHYTQLPNLIAGNSEPIAERVKKLMGAARTVVSLKELAKSKSLIEVPYRFCSDEYVGGVTDCYRFDQGPDSYERVANLAGRYWNYYIFDAFKRGRLAFGMNMQSYISRIMGRYFEPIADQYKHFVNDAFIAGKVRSCAASGSSWMQNPKCGEHTFAAGIFALNFFGRVLQIPDTGCYTKTTKDGKRTFKRTGEACKGTKDKNKMNIPLGVGRKMQSSFDWTDNGYEFYWKPLNVGAWWDKYLAILALGNPRTRFIGVDSSANPRSYLINFNALFGRYVNNMIGSFISSRPSVYGPMVNLKGEMIFRDAISLVGGEQFADPNPQYGFTTPVDPNEQYTAKVMAGFLSAVYFSGGNDDQSLNESMKISVRGFSESPEIPDEWKKDENRYVELVEPGTSRIYFAVHVENQGKTFNTGPDFFSTGFEILSDIKRVYYEKDGRTLKQGVSPSTVNSKFHFIKVMMGWLRAGEYNRR